MVDARILGCKKSKCDIHRLPIHGIEIDRLVQQDKCTNYLVDTVPACMRQRDSMADTCRPERFATEKRIQNCVGFQPIAGSRSQDLHSLRLQEFGKIHYARTILARSCRFDLLWVDPANVSVVTTIHDIHALFPFISKHQHRSAC